MISNFTKIVQKCMRGMETRAVDSFSHFSSMKDQLFQYFPLNEYVALQIKKLPLRFTTLR